MEREITSLKESEETFPWVVPSKPLREVRNSSCTICPLHKGASSVCVPGEGSGSLPLMILGEAPGRQEDLMGRPFVGMSGKLLRSTLLKVGVPLKKCYITNTVKCFPNGTPDKNEIAKCSGKYLKEEIRILNPSYILAVGKVALGAVLPGYSLSEVRGSINQSWVSEAFVFAIWHPAYILRNRSKQPEWENEIDDIWKVIQLNEGILPDQRS